MSKKLQNVRDFPAPTQLLGVVPRDAVGLATLLRRNSLDTTRLYSQPSVEQLSARVEQLNINAYAQ